MAKKKILAKPNRARPAYEPLGLITKQKKKVGVSFRLGQEDLLNLDMIAKEMDQNSKTDINRTDAIKALIQYGLKVKKPDLVRALGETV